MMCNLVCSSMGRHVHIDYCRAEENAPCDGAEVQHISARMVPNPDRHKDAITHTLYWRRLGTLYTYIYKLSHGSIPICRIQRSHPPTFFVPIQTDFDNQIHTLVMNRPILQNGASPSLFSGITSSSDFTIAMLCAQVCRGPGADKLIPSHDSYSGPEHSTAAGSGRPSYCTLPLFHPLRNREEPIHGRGYISNDGHLFDCRNPIVVQPPFHV